MRFLFVALVASVACSSEPLPPPAASTGQSATDDGATSEASGSGDMTTDDADGGDGDGDTGGETGETMACRDCYAPFCEAEAAACFQDSACTCLLECDDDPGCESQCGTSQVVADLFVCIADAQTGPCELACGNPCDSCVYDACASEFAGCFAEPSCVCALACDDDACRDACMAGAAFDAVEQCLGVAGTGACLDICG